MQKIFYFVLFSFFVPVVYGDLEYYSPENILKFAEYLYQEGDYLRAAGEYQRYLFYFPKDSDNIIYKIGLCYRLGGNVDKAIGLFNKIKERNPEGQLYFSASYQIAYSYYLSGQYEKSNQFLDSFLSKLKDAKELGQFQILKAFNYLNQRRWLEAEDVLEKVSMGNEKLNSLVLSLKGIAKEGIGLPRKNPTFAGLFSGIIPGTGRMYCKQYGDGIYSLVLVALSGLLAWDGFRDDGVRSLKGWLFGGTGVIFYGGNVYGSYLTAKVYNHQLEMNLLRKLPAEFNHRLTQIDTD